MPKTCHVHVHVAAVRQPKAMELLQALLLCVAAKGCHCVYLCYKFFFRPGKELRKYGEWAVVTGATDGIGKAYAFELAKQGLNVLLVARSEEKLKETAQELRAKYPVTVDQLKARDLVQVLFLYIKSQCYSCHISYNL